MLILLFVITRLSYQLYNDGDVRGISVVLFEKYKVLQTEFSHIVHLANCRYSSCTIKQFSYFVLQYRYETTYTHVQTPSVPLTLVVSFVWAHVLYLSTLSPAEDV